VEIDHGAAEFPYQQLAAYFRERIAACRLAVANRPTELCQFVAEPLIKFDNPISFIEDGFMFLWTDRGRPAAVVKSYHNLPNKSWGRTFVSIATRPIELQAGDKKLWSPQEAGISFAALPGGPQPAEQPRQRLPQMREIARRFQVVDRWGIKDPTDWQLRLLTAPLYRYEVADEGVVDGALFGVFINQGEVCSAGSRILVEKKIYSKFVDAMTEKAKRIKLGAPMERETKMGPLVSKEQYDRVSSYLEIGKKEAKVAIGGGRPKQFGKGYYVEPTIFYDVENSARIAREEIFGPVASVIPFDGEGEAIRIANDTPYGLAAAVWTRDIFKAFRIVKALRAGIVWVNHMQPTYVEAPWGGYKQSGIGRELGKWGVDEYLNVKQVYINLSEQPIGWY
jgi:hypothetical protein